MQARGPLSEWDAYRVRNSGGGAAAAPKRTELPGCAAGAAEQAEVAPPAPPARCDACDDEAECRSFGLVLCGRHFRRETKAMHRRLLDPDLAATLQRGRVAAACAAPLTEQQLQFLAHDESEESEEDGFPAAAAPARPSGRRHAHALARKALRLQYHLQRTPAAEAVLKQLLRVASGRNAAAIEALAKLLPKSAFPPQVRARCCCCCCVCTRLCAARLTLACRARSLP